jgi:FtsP/CotA-like multicopper oxidase with cupredoxin domain
MTQPARPPRRAFVCGLGGAAALALGWPATARTPVRENDLCAREPDPALHIGTEAGWLGRLVPAGSDVALRAGPAPADPAVRWALAYDCTHRGRRFLNPTLVVERGERLRVTLNNALAEPTIVHWHGLSNDTANDGGGTTLCEPGRAYR